jgi:hypothetical protein
MTTMDETDEENFSLLNLSVTAFRGRGEDKRASVDTWTFLDSSLTGRQNLRSWAPGGLSGKGREAGMVSQRSPSSSDS